MKGITRCNKLSRANDVAQEQHRFPLWPAIPEYQLTSPQALSAKD
jgi:hypothetical protein